MPARILIVDDDPLTGELICEILRSAGMDASFLTSSNEAAGRLQREKYHAVFLDMHMPALQMALSSPGRFVPPALTPLLSS